MHRCIWMLVLGIFMFSCSSAEGTSSAGAILDTSVYSVEELKEIKAFLDGYLPATEMGEVLYQEDGISVVYRGVIQDNDYYKVNLIIANNTGEDIQINLDTVAYNGCKLGMSNGSSVELEQGISLVAGSLYQWLTDSEDLALCGIYSLDDITSVSVIINVYDVTGDENYLDNIRNRELLRSIRVDIIGENSNAEQPTVDAQQDGIASPDITIPEPTATPHS